MRIFKQREKLKELYSEHPGICHLDSIINILLYLLYHMFVHISIPLSTQQSVLL